MKQTLCQCQGFLQSEAVLCDHIIPNGELNKHISAHCWSVAFSPDGSLFAWSSGYKLVTIIPWNRYKGTRDFDRIGAGNGCIAVNAGSLICSLAFGTATPDIVARDTQQRYRYKKCQDLLLATGLANGKIRIWNAYNGCMVFQLLDHKDAVNSLKFAPDGSFKLASAARDGTIKFWDLTDDGNRYHSISFNKGSNVYAIAWSPDARRIASVTSGQRAVIWDATTFRHLVKLPSGGHHYEIVDIVYSPDGALIATASFDTRVLVWDAYNGIVLRELRHMNPPPKPIYASGANGHFVRSVAFNAHGTYISTVADDGLVRFWSLDNDCCPEQVAPCDDALCVTFACASNTVAVGTRAGDVQVLSPAGTAAAQPVPPLKHMCRLVIRYNMSAAGGTDACDALADAGLLPASLRQYLKYF